MRYPCLARLKKFWNFFYNYFFTNSNTFFIKKLYQIISLHFFTNSNKIYTTLFWGIQTQDAEILNGKICKFRQSSLLTQHCQTHQNCENETEKFGIQNLDKPMLILLFDGAPSVPKETQMEASSISLIGANPSIRIAEAGQWDTLTPALERKPIWKAHE